MTTYYELLSDNTIGRSTPSEKVATSLGLTLTTEKEIVYGYDGKRYFKDEEPAAPEPSYTEQRAAEYPPMVDYLDAQVKINSKDAKLMAEGQAQMDAYVAACLAVKEKYPKPAEEGCEPAEEGCEPAEEGCEPAEENETVETPQAESAGV